MRRPNSSQMKWKQTACHGDALVLLLKNVVVHALRAAPESSAG
jgi:hypothetical protein